MCIRICNCLCKWYFPIENYVTASVPTDFYVTACVPTADSVNLSVPTENPVTAYVPNNNYVIASVPTDYTVTAYVPTANPVTASVPTKNHLAAYVPTDNYVTASVPNYYPITFNLLFGEAKLCLETLVRESDLNNARDEIKRKRDIGQSLKIKYNKCIRITSAQIIHHTGIHGVGKYFLEYTLRIFQIKVD